MAVDQGTRKGFRENLATFLYGESRNKNVAPILPRSELSMPSLFPPSEVEWSVKDVGQSRQFAFKHM